MLSFIFQYLLLPWVFLLTFILPVVIYLINRNYVWLSIPLTVIIEVMINWANLCYYESRGLVILFIAVQIAVMAIFILLLKAIHAKITK